MTTTTVGLRRLTEEDLVKALEALGDTADQVAQTLADAGCRGGRGCSENCPVANYLTSVLGAHDVSVMNTIDPDDNEWCEAVVTMQTPLTADVFYEVATLVTPAVQEFITRFDTSVDRYPECDWQWSGGEA